MEYALGALAGIAAITGLAYALAAWIGTRIWPGNPGRIVGAAFAPVGGGTLALIGTLPTIQDSHLPRPPHPPAARPACGPSPSRAHKRMTSSAPRA